MTPPEPTRLLPAIPEGASAPEFRGAAHPGRLEAHGQGRPVQTLIHGRLQASRARYFDLYDLAPVGYCTLSAEGLVLEANATAARMLGVAKGDLVRQPFTRFILPEDLEGYRLHPVEAAHACELRMVRADGSEFWVQLTTTGVPAACLEPGDEDEDRLLSRVVLSDISGLKALEEERTALALRLHQAKKLETLGVLAVGISHEFNHLLTGIRSSASTGARMAAGDPDQAHFFEVIDSSARKGAELLRHLLAYAGVAKWAVEEVDLGSLVKEIGQSLTFSLPWNLALTCSLADRLPLWRGDAIQVYQVAMNLVMNSFEAFPEGQPGEIAIRTRAEGLTGADGGSGTWVLPAVPGRYVVLEVEDNGTGMSPQVLAQAFEPFYTTKASGRGLGLAAVHGILSSHGCGLWIRSCPRVGTTIRIYLPALAGATEVSAL